MCNIWTDVKLPWLLPCYFHWKPVYICRGHAAIMQTHANEAMHDGGSQGWSPWCTCNFSVWTVDQAVTLRCFESTRLPQSVLPASEPSSDFRRNHFADSIMIFWYIFAEIMSPTTLGLFGNNRRNIILDFQHAGQNSMDSGFNYVWLYWMPYIVFEKYLMWLFY